MRRLIYVVMLFVCGLIVGCSLWNIDWAMWYRHFYLYYLPPYWHCCVGQCNNDARCPPPNDLGFWVNIQYLQIALACIGAVVASYRLASKR